MTDTTDTKNFEALGEPALVKTNVVRQRNGAKTFALYLELVEYHKDKTVARHAKMLMHRDMVVTYERAQGRKAARWIVTKVDGLSIATAQADKFLKRYGTGNRFAVTRGGAFLVELTQTDLEDIARGEAPYARYTGAFAVEHRLGKVDDGSTYDGDAPITPF